MKEKLLFYIIVISLVFILGTTSCNASNPTAQSTLIIMPSKVINASVIKPSEESPLKNEKITQTTFVSFTPTLSNKVYPGPETTQIQNPTSAPTLPEAYPPVSPKSTPIPTLPVLNENLLSPTVESSAAITPLAPSATENQLTKTPIIITELVATDPSTVNLVSGQPLFIELFAFWCPICRSMAPIVHRLEIKYSAKIRFVYLDIDNSANDAVKLTLGYKSPPQLFLLDGQGNILNQWNGYVSEEELEAALTALR